MPRKVKAVIAGSAIGSLVNLAIIKISAQMHPMPEGVTFSDQEGVKEWIENLPLSGFLMALLAHQLGTFLAGVTASLITKQKWIVGGVIVGVYFLIGGAMMLKDFASPTWFAVADIGLYIPTGVLGAIVAGKLVRPNAPRENLPGGFDHLPQDAH